MDIFGEIWYITQENDLVESVGSMGKESFKKQSFLITVIQAVLAACVILAESIQLNYSAVPSLEMLLQRPPMIILVNAAILAAVNLAVVLILQSWRLTLLLTSVAATCWSIANYFVTQFHGSPLFFSEFANFRTAMAVAGNYRFGVTKVVIGILLIFLTEAAAILVHRLLGRGARRKKRWLFRLLLLGADLALLYAALFGPSAVKPAHTIGGWSWVEGVANYGYVSCIVEDLAGLQNLYKVPNRYSADRIEPVEVDNSDVVTEYPDIILILNESFCDLREYADIPEAGEVLAPLYDLDNAVLGLCAAPYIGGSTNDSEFELLTSNSMYLLNRSSPFNYLNLTQLDNHVVKYVHQLDYSAVGMHCETKSNYSRNSAYPALGFDRVMLGPDSFRYFSLYGNRKWLDADNYHDLTDVYEEAGKPSFFFLLTYQNHGGWNQNDPEYDRIHVAGDYGELTDDLDEYLTSIKMGADAFVELTEYYARSERPTVICMVGDHAPSFIGWLPAKQAFSAEETGIVQRLVPYVIWANFDAVFPAYTEYASMVDLVPMVMQTAGMPLTPYYQYILDLHDVVPLRLSNGLYRDREGTIGTYGSGDGMYDDMLTQYYYMEYNALKAGSDYREELFEVGH
jgi:hypothetical protein